MKARTRAAASLGAAVYYLDYATEFSSEGLEPMLVRICCCRDQR